MQELDLSTVRERLALSDRFANWIATMPPADLAEPVPYPDDLTARRLLDQLGVDPVDQAAVIAAQPDPAAHPELGWIASRVYQDLIGKMGWSLAEDGFMGWPGPPESSSPIGRHLYAWIFLAAVPAVRRFHHDRGIGDAVSWTTLRAFGGELAQRRRLTGISGMSAMWTLPLVFRGAAYWLGRHVYDRGHRSLNVHIPEGGPLDPIASEASFAWARDFFRTHFPEEPVGTFTCHSWLLDPQWEAYLSPASNIVRFQRPFTLMPIGARPELADGDILRYVFHRDVGTAQALADVLDELPQETSLQRAYVAHLRSGHHWLTRTGEMAF